MKLKNKVEKSHVTTQPGRLSNQLRYLRDLTLFSSIVKLVPPRICGSCQESFCESFWVSLPSFIGAKIRSCKFSLLFTDAVISFLFATANSEWLHVSGLVNECIPGSSIPAPLEGRKGPESHPVSFSTIFVLQEAPNHSTEYIDPTRLNSYAHLV